MGDLVLILHENLPRNLWPFGLVIRIYPGADGHVRTVQVKTLRNVRLVGGQTLPLAGKHCAVTHFEPLTDCSFLYLCIYVSRCYALVFILCCQHTNLALSPWCVNFGVRLFYAYVYPDPHDPIGSWGPGCWCWPCCVLKIVFFVVRDFNYEQLNYCNRSSDTL